MTPHNHFEANRTPHFANRGGLVAKLGDEGIANKTKCLATRDIEARA